MNLNGLPYSLSTNYMDNLKNEFDRLDKYYGTKQINFRWIPTIIRTKFSVSNLVEDIWSNKFYNYMDKMPVEFFHLLTNG